MAVALGKRKRRSENVSDHTTAQASESVDDNQDLQDIFRRAFEAKFKPLEVVKKKSKSEEYDEAVKAVAIEAEESDWSGFSEREDAVQVVEVGTSRYEENTSRTRESRSFMSSKPPSSEPKPAATAKRKQGSTAEDDAGETANLKNDLALQRLLKESHLIDSASTLAGPEGRNRHKATDMRLQSLGSRTSILEQKNMPLAHRKGIIAKAAEKEDRRRKDAKENGIVLERAVGKGREPAGRRERSVGGPSVGKFRGGTLNLSKRDVASIEGPKDRKMGGRRGGKRR